MDTVTLTIEEAEKLVARLEYDASWDKCGSGYYSIKRQLEADNPDSIYYSGNSGDADSSGDIKITIKPLEWVDAEPIFEEEGPFTSSATWAGYHYLAEAVDMSLEAAKAESQAVFDDLIRAEIEGINPDGIVVKELVWFIDDSSMNLDDGIIAVATGAGVPYRAQVHGDESLDAEKARQQALFDQRVRQSVASWEYIPRNILK